MVGNTLRDNWTIGWHHAVHVLAC